MTAVLFLAKVFALSHHRKCKHNK